MEFAHLIKSPRVEKVILQRPFHKSTEGTLCITGHHLIFSAGGENPDELWVIELSKALLNFKVIFLFFTADPQKYRLCRQESKQSSFGWWDSGPEM